MIEVEVAGVVVGAAHSLRFNGATSMIEVEGNVTEKTSSAATALQRGHLDDRGGGPRPPLPGPATPRFNGATSMIEVEG